MIAVTSSMSLGAATMRTSVNLRLRRRRSALEKIEIAALVGLCDMALVERTVAALVARLGLLPRGAAARELGVAYFQLQTAIRYVELDQVAGADQRERPADEGYRRDVQYASAVARPAHPRIGDPHHVTHALLQQLSGHRQLVPFQHTRSG